MAKNNKDLTKDGLGLSPGLKTLGSKGSSTTVGQIDTRMPKSKKMGTGFEKPSQFFKSEEFSSIKKKSIEDLRSFLERKQSKRK